MTMCGFAVSFRVPGSAFRRPPFNPQSEIRNPQSS